jgi:hypothetical protein
MNDPFDGLVHHGGESIQKYPCNLIG